MWYVRTADRLERTATWQRKLPGGIDQVRRVVVEDALGIAADLEADMAGHVDAYECEWAATLADPERLRGSARFVNDPTSPTRRRRRRDPRPAGAGMTDAPRRRGGCRCAPPPG